MVVKSTCSNIENTTININHIIMDNIIGTNITDRYTSHDTKKNILNYTY